MVAVKESENLFSEEEISQKPLEQDEAVELLAKTRAILRKKLSYFVIQGFFEPLNAISLSNNKLYLQAPTLFHRNWVVDHYMAELNSAIFEACGEEINAIVTFTSDTSSKDVGKKKLKEKPVSQKKQQPFAVTKDAKENEENNNAEEKKALVLPIKRPHLNQKDRAPLTQLSRSNLNPSYSFEDFVQGPSNEMGYAAALSVAEHPGSQFSPLFLFGEVGLGKTHLLHAIGLRAKQKNPTLKIAYLSAEAWVNSYIQSIRERQFESFRNKYRNDCDVLLIDDIQFLAGKDASQDEFFHTFNYLHEAKKQIVVTSDKYPHEIDGLEARLQTRLSWGLVADIRPPEIETRIAILHKKAQSLSVEISDEILRFLAANVKNSVRELEGALVRIAACSSLTKHELNLKTTKEILAPVIKREKVVVSWQEVCDVVAAYYDLRNVELLGKSRRRQVAFARQIAMTICRNLLTMSLPEIGRAFGNRDHSTVLSSIRKIENIKRTDISFQSVFNKLEDRVRKSASH